MIKLGTTEITLPGIDSGYVGTNLVYSSYTYNTITGISPLFLTNSLNKSLRSLTQYGKCVQDGTPTPDAPVDIMCNNGAIKFGWHDIITTSQLSGYGTYVSPMQAATTRAYRWLKDLSNGAYMFSVDGDYEIIVQWRDPADPADGVAQFYENLSGWMKSGEVALDKSTGGYGIAVRRTSGTDSITPSNFDGVLHVQERGFYADGTQEVLTVSGKNLYDAATKISGYYIAADGTITSEPNSAYSALIPVSPNTTYVLSGYTASHSSNKRIHAYDSNGNWISQINYVPVAGPIAYSVSGTTPANCRYVRVSIVNSDTDVQFEDGSTATAYELYTAQTITDIPMLLSVGDIEDEGELISGIKTGKIGVFVSDGTANWVAQVSTPNGFAVSIPGKLQSRAAVIKSTHYAYNINILPNIPDGCVMSFGTTAIGIKDTRFTTVEALNAEHAAHPVIFIYPIATETTEQTTPHELNSYAGDTTVSWTAAVEGTEKTIEYAYKEPPSNLVGTAIVGTAKCT